MPVEHYIYDSQNILTEANELESIQTTYTYEPDEYGKLISQNRSGQTSYYHYDVLGSTRKLTDDLEAQTDSYVYSAFGEIIEKTGETLNPFRYIGSLGYYFNEESNDYYIRRRVYHPNLARFTSRDPLFDSNQALVTNDLFELNNSVDDRKSAFDSPYTYVENNPILYVDPSGLKKCKVPPKEFLDLMKKNLKNPGWQDKDGRISLATVACVACQESDYRPCVDSTAKGIGIMQVTPIGWQQCLDDSKKSGIAKDGKFTLNDNSCCKKELNPVPECGPDCEKNAWNWENNVRCGIYLLKYCRDKVKRKVPLQEILSCYNSGDYESTSSETMNYKKQIKECIPDMKKKLDAQK